MSDPSLPEIPAPQPEPAPAPLPSPGGPGTEIPPVAPTGPREMPPPQA